MKKNKKLKQTKKVEPKKVKPKKIKPKKVNKVPVKVAKPKKKINLKKVFIFILICYLIVMFINSFLNFKIKNIIIIGNENISDQKIIEIAKISNYPSFFKTMSKTLEKRLIDSNLVSSADVTKKINGTIQIEVVENHALFYNSATSKTILFNGVELSKKEIAPILINYVPDNVYPLFLEAMKDVKKDIIMRISEIQYIPNEVDEMRFMLYMNDGNYVYLTISKFDNINDYVSIMENITAKFGSKNGILHLDSGGYFDLLD